MTATLQHEAFVYTSDEHFVTGIAPFLKEGIAAGDGTVVATTDRNRDMLTRALQGAADSVVFVPAADLYRSPIDAISSYDSVLDQFKRDGRTSVRAVGEVAYDAFDLDRWMRYEPVAHHVFEQSPLHVVCPYDARILPATLIEHAARTHPYLHGTSGVEPNDRFVEPARLLSDFPEGLSMAVPADPDLVVDVGTPDGQQARRAVAAAVSAALDPGRADEANLAIFELFSNAIRHGAGGVTATVWTVPDAVVCRVRNDGSPIDDPFAGYRPPSAPERGGMGLWIVRRLADEVQIDRDDRGPVVTVAFRR